MQQIFLLPLLWLANASPEACSAPPRIASSVAALHSPVTEQASYNLAEIQEMARKSGLPLRHATLGFYIGSLSPEILTSTERRTNGDGSVCGYLTTVTVRLSLVGRLVEVANDLEGHGCNSEAVLRHYRKHAAADDAVLSQFVQRVNQALRDAWLQMQSKLGTNGGKDELGLKGVVETVLDQVLQDYKPVRTETLAAVDSPEEMESLACGSRT